MEAIAEFDFVARDTDELSFQGGATLLITNLGEDENWFKAVLHRSEGYIPKNYVRFSIPSWFWGSVSRGDAEKMLIGKGNQIGTFCVRHSESVQGAFSLSVRSGKESVHHFKLLPDKDGLYYIWLKKFKSLNTLIEYYKTNSVTTNSKLFLKAPNKKLRRCKALFDFSPVETGEMSLRRGQEIQILDDTDIHWWRGCVNGKQGVFPANYVTKVE